MAFDYALLREQFTYNAHALERMPPEQRRLMGITDEDASARIAMYRALAAGPDTDLEPHRAAIARALGTT